MIASIADRKKEIAAAFSRKFQSAPELIARAPGRVNLIGEHTDYNEGFVLPVAIDREVIIAADRNATEGMIELYSAEYDELDSFSIDDIRFSENRRWANYVRGVLACLKEQGKTIPSFRAAISGNVPQGAGLSSSAALEVATATLLNHLGTYGLNGKEIALIAQKAENEFVGVRCGIMDQAVSSLAQMESALLIDCRDLSFDSIPLHLSSQSVSLVITHTGVSRGLADSKYNERHSECQEGSRLLREGTGKEDLLSLRDVDSQTFQKYANSLPEPIRQRVKHVMTENERVKQAAVFLRDKNLQAFGKLMLESHNSLKIDYEVSCFELDTLVDLSLETAGCLGARMTGAGFGGCTVALFEQDKVTAFIEQTLSLYKEITGKTPSAYVCSSVAGAGLVS